MKRPLEMMNPISQSAIFRIPGMEEGRGEKRHQGISLFILLLLTARPGKQKKAGKQKTEKQ